MSLDLSQDWQVFDSPKTITYIAKLSEGSWQGPYTINYCQREEITKTDAKVNPSILEKDTIAWHLWTYQIGLAVTAAAKPTFTPKISDYLTDGTTNWLVKTVEMLDMDDNGIQRYRLLCIKTGAPNPL